MTAEQKLTRDICEGAFLEALGDHAIAEIQLKNPKDRIYEKDLSWIKEKWEDCFQPN